MVFDAHDRAFALFKTPAVRGICDNMKTAVGTNFVGKNRRYNRGFLQVCSHYLVQPASTKPPCRTAEPYIRVKTRLAHWHGEGVPALSNWAGLLLLTTKIDTLGIILGAALIVDGIVYRVGRLPLIDRPPQFTARPLGHLPR